MWPPRSTTPAAAARNGDWVLEATTGLIEAQTLAPVTYDGLLATPFTTRAGTLDQSFDGDGKVRTIDNNYVRAYIQPGTASRR